MKRLVTMLCSTAFLIAGILISKSTTEIKTATQTLHAATRPTIIGPAELPLDLQLDLVKHDTVIVKDTIYPAFLSQDVVIEKPKKQRRRKKSVEPDTVPTHTKTDTLYVPSMYIIVPLIENIDSTIYAKM